jgi:hypothetical protein
MSTIFAKHPERLHLLKKLRNSLIRVKVGQQRLKHNNIKELLIKKVGHEQEDLPQES